MCAPPKPTPFYSQLGFCAQLPAGGKEGVQSSAPRGVTRGPGGFGLGAQRGPSPTSCSRRERGIWHLWRPWGGAGGLQTGISGALIPPCADRPMEKAPYP